jgi:hypothetical protein
VGPWGEAKPVVGLFKCPWLNLGVNLTSGDWWTQSEHEVHEEGKFVAVSRTLGLSLIGIFAAGASPSNAASKGGGKEADGGGKGGYGGT